MEPVEKGIGGRTVFGLDLRGKRHARLCDCHAKVRQYGGQTGLERFALRQTEEIRTTIGCGGQSGGVFGERIGHFPGGGEGAIDLQQGLVERFRISRRGEGVGKREKIRLSPIKAFVRDLRHCLGAQLCHDRLIPDHEIRRQTECGKKRPQIPIEKGMDRRDLRPTELCQLSREMPTARFLYLFPQTCRDPFPQLRRRRTGVRDDAHFPDRYVLMRKQPEDPPGQRRRFA